MTFPMGAAAQDRLRGVDPEPVLTFPQLGGVTQATSRALNEGVGLTSGVELNVDPRTASVSTSFGVSGLTTLLALLFGVWALDRYVLDVPGIGRGA